MNRRAARRRRVWYGKAINKLLCGEALPPHFHYTTKTMQETQFRVCIIDSPSPHDLMLDRSPARALFELLNHLQIASHYSVAFDKTRFKSVLSSFIRTSSPTENVIVHINAHGNQNGFALTRSFPDNNLPIDVLNNPVDHSQFIQWQELSTLMAGLQEQTSWAGLALSSCKGAGIAQVASIMPVDYIIGCLDDIQTYDVATAFSYLYRSIQKGNIHSVIPVLSGISGNCFAALHGKGRVRTNILDELLKLTGG